MPTGLFLIPRRPENLPRQLPKRHTARNLNSIKAMIDLAQHD